MKDLHNLHEFPINPGLHEHSFGAIHAPFSEQLYTSEQLTIRT